MKILMLLESEFPHDVRVENEINALTKAGHEIHLACFTKKGRPEKDRFGDAVIHRRSVSPFIYRSSVASLKFPFYFNFWRKYLLNLLSGERFDAIHVHDLPLSRIGTEIKEMYDIPLVIDLHENWPDLLSISPHTRTILGRFLCSIKQWKSYEKKYLQYADRIIVVVSEAGERLMEFSVPEHKIVVVSNTMNISEFRRKEGSAKNEQGKKILIYEGGITFHRGIQYVLRALEKIRHAAADIEFRIVGTGKYEKNLRTLSSKLGLNEMVRFYGWQSQEKVYDLLGEADLAVIPHIKSSHTDTTIPHKLFHYMYAGIPILSSNCAPLERIINETSSGYVYQYDNVDELADKIKSLLISGSLSKQVNGREWVISKYNWDSDKRRLLDLYDRLGKA
jgi:glycosyltransferase involved in cell wall biosynthesis